MNQNQTLNIIFALGEIVIVFGLVAMLIIGARYYRRQENFSYYWLPFGMFAVAGLLGLMGIGLLISFMMNMGSDFSDEWQNNFAIVTAFIQVVLYFISMILFAVGGRTLRSEKKYGWLAIGMMLISAYLFIMFVNLVAGLYDYFSSSPMM